MGALDCGEFYHFFSMLLPFTIFSDWKSVKVKSEKIFLSKNLLHTCRPLSSNLHQWGHNSIFAVLNKCFPNAYVFSDYYPVKWMTLTPKLKTAFILARKTYSPTPTIIVVTDYGRPMKYFSIKIPNLERQIGLMNSALWVCIFGQSISTHFGTLSPLSMVSINQPLFLQKT